MLQDEFALVDFATLVENEIVRVSSEGVERFGVVKNE